MKKIFLFTLLTCFMYVNGWATDVARISVEGQADDYATSLTELNTKIAALSSPATVTLLQNINVTEFVDNVTLTVPSDKNVTLNLNGKSIIQHWNVKGPSGGGDCDRYQVVDEAKANTWGVSSSSSQADLQSTYEYAARFGQDCGIIEVECEGGTSGDINENAIIYNKGTLHIVSEGDAIVQMTVGGRDDSAKKQATTICNDGNLTIDGGIFIGPNGEYDLPKCPVIWAKSASSNITINGGTFLCYEGVSDFHKGANWGPITGPGTWTIKGGIFSTDEMQGTPLERARFDEATMSVLNEHKSTKDYWLTGDKAPATGYTAIEVPYTNANIDGYTVEYRQNAYYSYIKENPGVNEVVNNDDKPTLIANGDTIHNGICPDPVKMGQKDASNKNYCYYVDRSTSNGAIAYYVTEDSAKNNVYYQRYRYPVKPVCMVVPNTGNLLNVTSSQSIEGTVEKDYVNVAAGATLTIPNGATLKVGGSGVVLSAATAKIVIEAGGTLLSNGDIITAYNENIELTMDARANKYSTLALKANNIQAKHPNATVVLKSVNNYDGEYTWQRFAIPTYQTNLTRSIVHADVTVGHEFQTALYRWDYDSSEENKWTSVGAAQTLNPFECYIMTINQNEEANYIFKCELVGNGNPTIALHNDWNFLANSYTAPIQIGAVLNRFRSDANHIMTQGVWVQEKPTSTEWASITYADIVFGDMIKTELNPMQAFVFHKPEGGANSIVIDYENYVSAPLFPAQNNAPARHQSVAEDITRAHVIVADENGDEETVKLYLSDDFSAAEDPGFDLPKFINEDVLNFYAVTDLGNLERVASNNLDEIALVLETKDATSFTMKFESVSLEGYSILDKLTETSTPIAAESEYAFTAEANSKIADRFVVVKGTATGIENIVNAGSKKGYYSMSGVYMGEDFHALPAGMYIINGKKVVK